MRRLVLTVAAILIPVAGLTLGFAGTAGAAGKLQCTSLSGNAATTVTVGGCTGGNTGGGSHPVSSVTLATGGTIPWLSGSTTTIGAPTLTPISAKHCPGYVKNAASEPAAESVTATVTGDTADGILIPATLTGEACVGTDGSISLLKTIKVSWTSSNIVCTTITGNAATTVAVSGCSGGHTGGGSQPVSSATLATGGTIPWLSGGSITIGAPALAPASAKHCPGYVKNAASEPTAESFTATVTSDTGDGLKALPGSAKGSVCLGTDGSITTLKPLQVK